jgi:hypothetical protein
MNHFPAPPEVRLLLKEIGQKAKTPGITPYVVHELEQQLESVLKKYPHEIILGPLLDQYLEASVSIAEAEKLI